MSYVIIFNGAYLYGFLRDKQLAKGDTQALKDRSLARTIFAHQNSHVRVKKEIVLVKAFEILKK